MSNNIQYISLGPWCHAAGILMACNLRTCSYPFDWCQSGSIQHEEVLELSPVEYYYRHMHNPTRHYNYKALTKPDKNGHTLGELAAKTPTYGYEFFYNPHRMPGKEKDYFLRCLKRLQTICKDSEVAKVFFIADYVGKPGNTFLDDYFQVASFIQDRLLSKVSGKSVLCIHRTRVCSTVLASNSIHQIDSRSYLALEDVPAAIESEAESPCTSLAKLVLTRLRLRLLGSELPRQLLSTG